MHAVIIWCDQVHPVSKMLHLMYLQLQDKKPRSLQSITVSIAGHPTYYTLAWPMEHGVVRLGLALG